MYPEVVSKFSAGHEANLNTKHVMDLCVRYGLVAIQTWHQRQVMNEKNWWTWCHPRSKRSHLKDLILVPAADRGKVRVCRPYDPPVRSDHRLIVCTTMHKLPVVTPASKRKWEQANSSLAQTSWRAKLRSIDISQATSPDGILRYCERLSFALNDLQPVWLATESPMQQAAMESLCKEVSIYEDTWLTPKAHDDLEAHMSDVQKLQHLLLKPENYGDVPPRLMHAGVPCANVCARLQHKAAFLMKLAKHQFIAEMCKEKV
jgi:hypothetical protein